MNCTEVNNLLDMVMDGTLDKGRWQAMQMHGKKCPQCAAAIRSTLQLKALFSEMEPEVDVPLKAQARWRSAVRAEAGRKGNRRHYRQLASVAAALVLLVGVGAALKLWGGPRTMDRAAPMEYSAEPAAFEDGAAESGAPFRMEAAPPESVRSSAVSNVAEGAVVEADGAGETAMFEVDGAAEAAMLEAPDSEPELFEAEEIPPASAAVARNTPAYELSIRVEDVDTACARVQDLAGEYEATADIQPLADGGANVYIEIAAGDAADFLNAVAPMDIDGNTVEPAQFADEGTVLVLLVVNH